MQCTKALLIYPGVVLRPGMLHRSTPPPGKGGPRPAFHDAGKEEPPPPASPDDLCRWQRWAREGEGGTAAGGWEGPHRPREGGRGADAGGWEGPRCPWEGGREARPCPHHLEWSIGTPPARGVDIVRLYNTPFTCPTRHKMVA
jgi:hypothetical protein